MILDYTFHNSFSTPLPFDTLRDMDKSRSTISTMFDRIASRYDLLNRVLSFGIDRSWRKQMIRLFPSKRPLTVLDIATGTADVPVMMADILGPTSFSHIVGGDISEHMLDVGRGKVRSKGLSHLIRLEIADATQLHFQDASFDVVTIAFGIRNVSQTEKALQEFFRVLTPGGKAFVLEFSMPKNGFIRMGYLAYFRYILPFIGGIISQDFGAYRYLNKSVEDYYSPDAFIEMMTRSGFQNVSRRMFCFGVASLYSGDKVS